MGLIFYIGILLIALAALGFISKSRGRVIPFLNSISNQLIIAGIGLTFIWVNHDKTTPEELSIVTNVYDSVSIPASHKVFIDTMAPKMYRLINKGTDLIDSIKAGDENAWENLYFYFTNNVYDVIRPAELFNKDGGIYQAKWYVLSRGRRVDGDRKYDSTYALMASQNQVEWIRNLRAGIDSVMAK